VDLLQRVRVRLRPVGLHAGVEHADRLHTRVRAERDGKKSSARLPHHGNVLEIDFAFERRAVARVFLFRPRDRFAQIVGVLLPVRGARLRHAADHEEAMRRDRLEEARIARAVDGAATVAPRHHRQLVLPRKCAEILRPKHDVTRRAKGGLLHDLVRAWNRFRRAFERQRCPDQVGIAAAAPWPLSRIAAPWSLGGIAAPCSLGGIAAGPLGERNRRSEDECDSEC
jgi:hypothetical protein